MTTKSLLTDQEHRTLIQQLAAENAKLRAARHVGQKRLMMTSIEQREQCALIAESLAKGQAVEIDGKQMLLGSMAFNPCDAQKLTAIAIAAVIRSLRGD
jgi:hypothetical protein